MTFEEEVIQLRQEAGDLLDSIFHTAMSLPEDPTEMTPGDWSALKSALETQRSFLFQERTPLAHKEVYRRRSRLTR